LPQYVIIYSHWIVLSCLVSPKSSKEFCDLWNSYQCIKRGMSTRMLSIWKIYFIFWCSKECTDVDSNGTNCWGYEIANTTNQPQVKRVVQTHFSFHFSLLLFHFLISHTTLFFVWLSPKFQSFGFDWRSSKQLSFLCSN
jgi:hypothetical protein